MSAHPSRGSWSHKELRRRPQRQGPHVVPRLSHVCFGTPLTRFVATWGASDGGHMQRMSMSAHP
eukprot:1821616-Pyramimonas_sp.AAC.1